MVAGGSGRWTKPGFVSMRFGTKAWGSSRVCAAALLAGEETHTQHVRPPAGAGGKSVQRNLSVHLSNYIDVIRRH